MKKNCLNPVLLFLLTVTFSIYSCANTTQQQGSGEKKRGKQTRLSNTNSSGTARMRKELTARDLYQSLRQKIAKGEAKTFEPAQVELFWEQYNKMIAGLQKKRREKEERYRKRFGKIRDFYLELEEIKTGLKRDRYNMADKLKQINDTAEFLEARKKVAESSEQEFRDQMKSMPIYKILLGVKTTAGGSFKDELDEITKNMENYLKSRSLIPVIIVDNENAQTKQEIKINEEISHFAGDWRYSIEQDGKIYMYRVYRIHPLYEYINEIPYENIAGFRLKKNKGLKLEPGVKIELMTGETKQDMVNTMLKFFAAQPASPGKINEEFGLAVDYVLKNTRTGLEEIKKIAVEFKEEAGFHRSLIKIKEVEFSSLVKALRTIYYGEEKKLSSGLIKKVNGLIEISGSFKISGSNIPLVPGKELAKIKAYKDKLKILFEDLVEKLKQGVKTDENDSAASDSYITGFIGIIKGIINKEIKSEMKILSKHRGEIISGLGIVPRDKYKKAAGNFEKAAEEAYGSIIKRNRISSLLDVMRIKKGQLITYKPDTYYREGIIKKFEIPFLCEHKKEAGDSQFIVLVEAELSFDMKGILKEKNGFVFDTANNLVWTKDTGNIGISYKGSDSVESLLQNLRGNNSNWRLITKTELEKIVNNKELFKALNMAKNRFYWTPTKIHLEYYTYSIQDKEGIPVLVEDKRISQDGAFYIFVRKMEEGEEDEL